MFGFLNEKEAASRLRSSARAPQAATETQDAACVNPTGAPASLWLPSLQDCCMFRPKYEQRWSGWHLATGMFLRPQGAAQDKGPGSVGEVSDTETLDVSKAQRPKA